MKSQTPILGARGFTLIELMVALFITAIIFAMGYGAVNQALAHSGAIKDQQARLLAVQTTVRVLAQDFEQAVARPVREPLGSTWQAAFLSQSTSAQGQNTGNLVTLTRGSWANPAGVPRPALQRVTYLISDGKLIREHLPVLDATLSNQPVRRELLTGVKSVGLRYMDSGRSWVDNWPLAVAPEDLNNNAVNQPDASLRQRPLAVEVTLDLEDWGKIVRLFEIPQ